MIVIILFIVAVLDMTIVFSVTKLSGKISREEEKRQLKIQ